MYEGFAGGREEETPIFLNMSTGGRRISCKLGEGLVRLEWAEGWRGWTGGEQGLKTGVQCAQIYQPETEAGVTRSKPQSACDAMIDWITH